MRARSSKWKQPTLSHFELLALSLSTHSTSAPPMTSSLQRSTLPSSTRAPAPTAKPTPTPSSPPPLTAAASPILPKRKRGRKPKVKLHLDHCYHEIDIIVNPNGVVMDLHQLANSQDPFAEELKRRTEGLHNKEELLGFLRDLPGQWGSRWILNDKMQMHACLWLNVKCNN
ncbi:hypothetical protein JHK82_055454 [Glycine max]|nr:hypothetical protein JHK82_055454 [Glycine max]